MHCIFFQLIVNQTVSSEQLIVLIVHTNLFFYPLVEWLHQKWETRYHPIFILCCILESTSKIGTILFVSIDYFQCFLIFYLFTLLLIFLIIFQTFISLIVLIFAKNFLYCFHYYKILDSNLIDSQAFLICLTSFIQGFIINLYSKIIFSYYFSLDTWVLKSRIHFKSQILLNSYLLIFIEKSYRLTIQEFEL